LIQVKKNWLGWRVLRDLIAESEEDDTSIAGLMHRIGISFRSVVHIRVGFWGLSMTIVRFPGYFLKAICADDEVIRIHGPELDAAWR